MSEYRHIGKATPRKDARSIVTGRAQYIGDLKMPGMLYGRVLRSPYPHARITEIDTTKAEAYPGVAVVLTYKNVPKWRGGVPFHRPVLNSTVYFVGDAVALLAAETEEIAEEALELIEVAYEQLPAVYDVEEAIKPGAPQLYPNIPGNIFPRGFPSIGANALQELVMGDVEKGFAEADFITEGTCAYENIPNPLPPEPPGLIAMWEDDSHLTIYTASQSASMNRNFHQPLLDFADIRVIGTQCGGSYGTKNANAIPLMHAAALAKAARKPVRVYFTKEEHFNSYSLRIGSRIHCKIGIKKDGTVTAVAGEWLVDTGAASEMAQVEIAVGCGEAQLMLRCSNWNLQPHLVCTNRSPSGVVRGFGGQELKSALIPVLSLALEKAGLNPLDFFKKNFVKAGDGYFWRDGIWWTSRGVDFTKAMDKGAESFGWKDKWKGWGIPTAVNGPKRIGVGVGLHGNADIGEDDSEAYVKLSADGRALLICCVSESGMGERSALCKMVAEVLDLPLDMVNITPPDTLMTPFEFGLVGSRGTYTTGSAAIRAAEDARKKLLELAVPVTGAKLEDLNTRDGKIFVKGNEAKTIPWHKVMGVMRTITGFGRYETDYSLSNFMMVFAEVEVDIESGKTDLRRIVAATDCGQIIDPLVLNGQLHGSIGSGGLDTALMEETIQDKSLGHFVNCNMIDYKWSTFLDLPEFQNVILESEIPSHRFKAVGVGEIAAAPGPSAVLMAVYNAIGKRIWSYPLTPDKILKSLGRI
ncbi:MAG: xanthine dehydrogenase family protein molybdopterin-binding subunit [Dehalococcoidales bacterium]|nr:xanthine dehydrogenase family protein molybdopterin-binding subunit [Dehalococcoidales bacterium]